jgi:uncharacterized protein
MLSTEWLMRPLGGPPSGAGRRTRCGRRAASPRTVPRCFVNAGTRFNLIGAHPNFSGIEGSPPERLEVAIPYAATFGGARGASESIMKSSTTFPALSAPRASSRIAAALTAAVFGLTACASSPPTQFYSLTPVSAQSPAPQSDSAASGAMPLRVAAVHVPPTLDRREVVRRGAGDRLEISGVRRWGAPFDEMVQHVLTQNLVDRLPSGSVVLPSSPAPSGTASVVVDLLQFQSDVGGAVILQGSWSLLAPGQSSPALVRDFRYEDSASGQEFEDVAAAMSRLLGHLADDIASRATAQH